MQNFLTTSYWFNMRAGSLEAKAQIALIIFIGLLFALAIVMHFLKKKKHANRKIMRRWQSLGITNGLIGLVLLFLTYERAPLLSARFWFLLWGIGILIWLISILKNYKVIIANREQIRKEEEYKKYLPK